MSTILGGYEQLLISREQVTDDLSFLVGHAWDVNVALFAPAIDPIVNPNCRGIEPQNGCDDAGYRKGHSRFPIRGTRNKLMRSRIPIEPTDSRESELVDTY